MLRTPPSSLTSNGNGSSLTIYDLVPTSLYLTRNDPFLVYSHLEGSSIRTNPNSVRIMTKWPIHWQIGNIHTKKKKTKWEGAHLTQYRLHISQKMYVIFRALSILYICPYFTSLTLASEPLWPVPHSATRAILDGQRNTTQILLANSIENRPNHSKPLTKFWYQHIP